MKYFTADTHFAHANIIKFCNRPFATAEEHDDALIENWNRVVGKGDEVYHLGDFCWGHHVFEEVFPRLNGQIHLIEGNHDHKGCRKFRDRFTSYSLMKEVKIGPDRKPLVMCHYAMHVWNKSHHGTWHIYGHTHGDLDEYNPRAIDIGVDCHQYTPVSEDQLVEIFKERETQGENSLRKAPIPRS